MEVGIFHLRNSIGWELINDTVIIVTGVGIEVEDCSLTMGKVPGKPFSYSDHEGVEATLSVEKKDQKGKKWPARLNSIFDYISWHNYVGLLVDLLTKFCPSNNVRMLSP